jgi:hypothetical protein
MQLTKPRAAAFLVLGSIVHLTLTFLVIHSGFDAALVVLLVMASSMATSLGLAYCMSRIEFDDPSRFNPPHFSPGSPPSRSAWCHYNELTDDLYNTL